MAAMLWETSTLPSYTLYNDVSLCLGTIISMNSVDFCVYCISLSSHVYIMRSHVRFHGNTKEGDKQRVSPKINNLASNGHVPHAYIDLLALAAVMSCTGTLWHSILTILRSMVPCTVCDDQSSEQLVQSVYKTSECPLLKIADLQ